MWRRIYEERKSVILPLALLLIANVGVLVLAVLPLETSVTGAEARAVDANLALAAGAPAGPAGARRADEPDPRAGEELAKFYGDVLPVDQATARKAMNLWVEQAAEGAGLQYRGAHYSVNDVRDSRLTRATSTITLQGRYQNLRRFLYAVEAAKEFLIIEKVEVAESGDQPTARQHRQGLGDGVDVLSDVARRRIHEPAPTAGARTPPAADAAGRRPGSSSPCSPGASGGRLLGLAPASNSQARAVTPAGVLALPDAVKLGIAVEGARRHRSRPESFRVRCQAAAASAGEHVHPPPMPMPAPPPVPQGPPPITLKLAGMTVFRAARGRW